MLESWRGRWRGGRLRKMKDASIESARRETRREAMTYCIHAFMGVYVTHVSSLSRAPVAGASLTVLKQDLFQQSFRQTPAAEDIPRGPYKYSKPS